MSLFGGYGAEVELKAREDFLKVMETLTRMGRQEDDTRFIQSCHILHKRGKYAIMHYNELYAFDGTGEKPSAEDIEDRNTVVRLLSKWKLVTPVVPFEDDEFDLGNLRILQHAEKGNWTIIQKYKMGNRNHGKQAR